MVAKVVFVGEAPGAKEDATGRPFVGRSGKFLDSVLAELGVDSEDVFITNIVRCRPPGNRKPSKSEIDSCLKNLVRELKAIRPKVVVALGATAIYALTGATGKLGPMIGNDVAVDFAGLTLKVVPCYHPSAAMRSRRMRSEFEKAVSNAISMSK
jgi:uracil-DNA glycosylase